MTGPRRENRKEDTSRWFHADMPTRIDLDLDIDSDDVMLRLIELGALDIDTSPSGGIAAILPEELPAETVARMLGVPPDAVRVSAATGYDDDSVWILKPRPVRAGRFRIVPAGRDAEPGAIRLAGGTAFGTGLHPTTALCLEVLSDELEAGAPPTLLDIGTGTGVLALAALASGVQRVVAIDLDAHAVAAAAANAALNDVRDRLQLIQSSVDALAGQWPFVVANIVAAPLIDLAPAIVRLMARSGTLVLSGIRLSLADEVKDAYRHLGMHPLSERMREGWAALTLRTSW